MMVKTQKRDEEKKKAGEKPEDANIHIYAPQVTAMWQKGIQISSSSFIVTIVVNIMVTISPP